MANVDITELMSFHESHGRLATVTAVRPSARFGAMDARRDRVAAFAEKTQAAAGWINGGFFVFERSVLDRSLAMRPLSSESRWRRSRSGANSWPIDTRASGNRMDTQRDLDHLNRRGLRARLPGRFGMTEPAMLEHASAIGESL